MRQAGLLAVSVITVACGAPAPAPPPAPTVEVQPAPQAAPEALAPADVESALAASGAIAFTDGTSIYTMHADHRFAAGPNGISGRTIEGRWRRSDGDLYEVFGHWGWMNGGSSATDFRRMRFTLQPPFRAASTMLDTPVPVVEGFFLVDELVRITPEEHEAGLASCR